MLFTKHDYFYREIPEEETPIDIGYYYNKYEIDVPYDLNIKTRDWWGDREYLKEKIIRKPKIRKNRKVTQVYSPH